MTSQQSPYRFKDVPGDSSVVLHVYPAGSVITRNAPYTLAELRQQWNGDQAELIHPLTGKKVQASLQSWAHLDPTTTRVSLAFVFKPYKPIPPQYQYLFPEIKRPAGP